MRRDVSLDGLAWFLWRCQGRPGTFLEYVHSYCQGISEKRLQTLYLHLYLKYAINLHIFIWCCLQISNSLMQRTGVSFSYVYLKSLRLQYQNFFFNWPTCDTWNKVWNIGFCIHDTKYLYAIIHTKKYKAHPCRWKSPGDMQKYPVTCHFGEWRPPKPYCTHDYEGCFITV